MEKARLFLVVLSAILLFACQSGLTPGEGSTGDPPLIPHEVLETDNGNDCLECHKGGDDDAPMVPEWHATLLDCRQCHVLAVDGIDEFKTQY